MPDCTIYHNPTHPPLTALWILLSVTPHAIERYAAVRANFASPAPSEFPTRTAAASLKKSKCCEKIKQIDR